MIIIYSSMSTPLTSTINVYSHSSGTNIIWFLFPLVLTICFSVKYNIKYLSFINKLLFIFLIWFIIQFFKTSNLYLPQFFFILYPLIVAYIIAYHYKSDIFVLYEKVVVVLSAITFVLWLLVILLPNTMESIMNSLSVVPVRNVTATYKSSIIFFNLTDSENYSFSPYIRRNAGFSWEAGRYAVMIIFAMYFNLQRNSFRINLKDKNFVILLLALFSSQSTTGYSAFLLIVIILLFQMKSSSKYLYFAIFISLFIYLMELDFYGGKIRELSDTDNNRVEQYVHVVENNLSEKSELGVSLQRFDAAAFQSINFIKDPLFGYGLDTKNAYNNKTIFSEIRYPNGDFTIFAEWGIFIALLFYSLLFKASFKMNEMKNNVLKVSFAIVFIVLNFSYNLWLVPILLSFIIYPNLRTQNHK